MRRRRVVGVVIVAIVFVAWWLQYTVTTSIAPTPQVGKSPSINSSNTTPPASNTTTPKARDILEILAVKGRTPKTGYARTQFGNGWAVTGSCDTRNRILGRDLVETVIGEACKVQRGILHDPYTGTTINFTRGKESSDAVQIDHVVALSNAWQTGAQQLDAATRAALANDPLELLAVDGKANQAKGDGDAATWLPSHKPFRCQYVARQIAVKAKYNLWVTPAEKSAMQHVLAQCPDETIPTAHQ